jgi:hypothetical protein
MAKSVISYRIGAGAIPILNRTMFSRTPLCSPSASDGRTPSSARTALAVLGAALLSGACATDFGLPLTVESEIGARCALGGVRIDAQALERARGRHEAALRGCATGTTGAMTPATPDGASGSAPVPVIRIDRVQQPGGALAPGCGTDAAGRCAAPGTSGMQRPGPADGEPPAAPAARPGATASADAVLSPPMRRLAARVDEVARRNEIDPLLLHALIHVESRHRSDAVSPAGARGVMQLMPPTAERFGVQDARHLHDDGFNLAAGAAYLKTLQAEFGGDLDLALAAYNAGEGAVRRHGRRIPPYPETQAYVRNVRAEYRRLQALRNGAEAERIALGEATP